MPFEPIDPNEPVSPAHLHTIREALGMDRDPERIERVLDLIRDIWLQSRCQQMRLLQLLLNALPNEHVCRHTMYNIEDTELEERLHETYGVR